MKPTKLSTIILILLILTSFAAIASVSGAATSTLGPEGVAGAMALATSGGNDDRMLENYINIQSGMAVGSVYIFKTSSFTYAESESSYNEWYSPKKFGLGGPGYARQISPSEIERIRIDMKGHSGYEYPHYNHEVYKIENGIVVPNFERRIKPIYGGELNHQRYLTEGGWE